MRLGDLCKKGFLGVHVHLPKITHSLREFVVEIGTITAGILIALSLEAGVEAWHHHELVEQARVNLRRELDDNRKGLVEMLTSERNAIAGLDRLTDVARSQMAGGKSSEAEIAINIDFTEMRTAAWESTVAIQALAHMSYEEAQALALAYSASATFNELQREARKPWIEMAATSGEDFAGMKHDQIRSELRSLRLNRAYATATVATGQQLVKVYDRALKQLD